MSLKYYYSSTHKKYPDSELVKEAEPIKTDGVEALLRARMDRRKAISTAAGVAVAAGVIAVAGVGTGIYYATKPPEQVTTTSTATSTATVTSTTASTATVTSTTASTATVTSTPLASTSTVTATQNIVVNEITPGGFDLKMYNNAASILATTHPEITLNLEQLSSNDYYANYFTIFKRPQPPDVVFNYVGAGSMAPLVTAGLVRNLDDFAVQYGWDKRITAAAQAYNKDTNGDWYILPDSGGFDNCFIYNVDLFKKQGWTPPDSTKIPTFDQFLTLGQTAKAAGLAMTTGAKDQWPLESNIGHLIAGALGPQKYADFNYNYGLGLTVAGVYQKAEFRYTSPEILDVFSTLALWGKQVFSDAAGSQGYDDALNAFAAQSAAMTWGYSGTFSVLKGKKLPFNWDFFWSPQKKFATIPLYFRGHVLSQHARQPQAAAVMLDTYVSQAEQLFLINGIGGQLPTVVDVPVDQIQDDHFKRFINLTLPGNPAGVVTVQTASLEINSALANAGRPIYEDVVLGNTTPQSAVNQMEAIAQRIASTGS